MTYIIAQPCVNILDKSCIEECPVNCIYEGERMLYIHPDECVDCGACEPVCPVEAIFYEDDVPDQWKDFYKANVEFFSDLGSPGGASKVGKINKDHPIVTALPPQGEAELTLAARLPRFPWDLLAPYGQKARAHPDGIVDLSVGTPVDPVPGLVQDALRAAANAPGYPATHGTRALREAAAGWLARRHGVTVEPDAVLPLIGTKEFIASLPGLLGGGPGDVVVYPELAYPTYDIGARLAGARGAPASDGLTALRPGSAPGLVWVNSPANPTGRVLPAGAPGQMVARAAASAARCSPPTSATSASAGTAEPVSVLHPAVCGGSFDGLLAVHSVSKRSNLAGYRAGFVTGDPALIAQLLEIRKHAGMMMPTPVQAAHDGGAQRRRARGAAALGVRGPPRPAADRPGEGRLGHHPLRGGPVPVGLPPGIRLLGVGATARGRGHPRRARRVLRPGRGAARPGGPHRHGRAGGRGRPPPRRPRQRLACIRPFAA